MSDIKDGDRFLKELELKRHLSEKRLRFFIWQTILKDRVEGY